MSWKMACGAVGALLLGAVAAQASDATMLADRAGFLVGHAHRCGVAEDRLRRAAILIDKLIAAFSSDKDDAKAARTEFDERVLASALADLLNDPVPPCAAVRSELVQLERHHGAVALNPGSPREGQMARDNRSDNAPASVSTGPSAKPAKSVKPASPQRENLTPERRADLELRRAAQQTRGKPPSI